VRHTEAPGVGSPATAGRASPRHAPGSRARRRARAPPPARRPVTSAPPPG